MKKKLYDYPHNKLEHDYKIFKIFGVIGVICIIVMILGYFFVTPNSNINTSTSKGWLGFIQSCASYALGWIF